MLYFEGSNDRRGLGVLGLGDGMEVEGGCFKDVVVSGAVEEEEEEVVVVWEWRSCFSNSETRDIRSA